MIDALKKLLHFKKWPKYFNLKSRLRGLIEMGLLDLVTALNGKSKQSSRQQSILFEIFFASTMRVRICTSKHYMSFMMIMSVKTTLVKGQLKVTDVADEEDSEALEQAAREILDDYENGDAEEFIVDIPLDEPEEGSAAARRLEGLNIDRADYLLAEEQLQAMGPATKIIVGKRQRMRDAARTKNRDIPTSEMSNDDYGNGR